MRKHENWFRLDKLNNYAADIGDIQEACVPLCQLVDDLLAMIPPRLDPPTPQDFSHYVEGTHDIHQHHDQGPHIQLNPLFKSSSTTFHQLNPPFNASAGILDDIQYPHQHPPPIELEQFLSSSHHVKLDQLDPHQTPWKEMNDIPNPDQEPVISLSEFINSSPPDKLAQPDQPENQGHAIGDVEHTGPEPRMAFTELFQHNSPSTISTNVDQLTPYHPFEGFKFADEHPVANLDELLERHSHEPADTLEHPYDDDLMRDLELAVQSHPVSTHLAQPSLPLQPQHNPASVPCSPSDSIKTDSPIISQLNRFKHKTETEDVKIWPQTTNSLSDNQAISVRRDIDLPQLGLLPYDVFDSHAPLDLPPIPQPVDIRPLPRPLDLISPRMSPRRSASVESEEDPELRSFASMTSDEQIFLNTDDLFACMSLDELKGLAKKLKANFHTTKDMIIIGIKAATCKQSTLYGAPSTTKGRQRKQLSLKFSKNGLKESQLLSLNSKILKIIGPAIKLRPKVCALFKRLHLIFYRSTTISEKTMTASMLAKMKLRNYPTYQVIRTNSIFDSREQLMKYEEALSLEKDFDELLVNERKPWNEDEQGRARRQEAKTLRLKKALDVFESAWLRWQQTVMEEDDRLEQLQLCQKLDEGDYDALNYYKKRFHQGWPLTRILQKGLAVLARFKEYEREVQVLEALIQQRHFRRGKRGQWYDRLALVLMSHLAAKEAANSEQRRMHENSALYTCQHGLSDPDTHQLYRFSLTRRLAKLHQTLDGGYHSSPPESPDHPSVVEDWRKAPRTTIHRALASDIREIGLKTRWISPLTHAAISVEEAALEYYTSHDPAWRGVHSETGILKMMFSLVFWDVIFAPVPGAFETSFQTAPLDMATDAFRIVRQPMISERMEKITELGLAEMTGRLRETYERESVRKTMAVGMSQDCWERYGLAELEEILRCFPVPAFLLIARVFFEDWPVWSAGAPDLCLWNPTKRQCKFVEVKGPGDKLSEQQKNWFSLLLRADGILVELCSVKELVDDDDD